MIKKTCAALIATVGLLSAGAAMADRPGAGWITIEKAIEIVKTKAGYVEVYEIEADNNGYWKGKGARPMVSSMNSASMGHRAMCCVIRKTECFRQSG